MSLGCFNFVTAAAHMSLGLPAYVSRRFIYVVESTDQSRFPELILLSKART